MISYLKISFSPMVAVFVSREYMCEYMNSIPTKYDVRIVKYNISSVKYITRFLHDDAIDVLLQEYHDDFISLFKITDILRCWNDAVCDAVISSDRSGMAMLTHYSYSDIVVPKEQELNLVRRFVDAHIYIHDISEEAKALHDFIHKL